MELTTIAKRNNPFRKFGAKFWRSKYLVMMIIPAIVFYIIFCYVPMYGVLMAFQKFNPKVGIFGSNFVGIDNFITVFDDAKFWLSLQSKDLPSAKLLRWQKRTISRYSHMTVC